MFLSIEKVSKVYSSRSEYTCALKNITLDIQQGEFICLLGPSGCGKSTLLNIISGLEKCSEGKVLYKNSEVSMPGSDRVVVFQESALFPWLKVVDNVEFGMKMLGISKHERREKALYYLKKVHLFDFKNHYIHELSGGMRQRVAIARAFTMDSELLLMDEPFSALDNHTKTILQNELLQLWQETKKTIVFVTHSPEEAVLLADKVILMSSRPGEIKKVYSLHVDRPRNTEECDLKELMKVIKILLKEEVEKDAVFKGNNSKTNEKSGFLFNIASYMGIKL